MDPKGLFRQAALEKLSSPERLDLMMQVTSPKAWITLGALGAILIVLVVWSIVGIISIKVRGSGILIRGSVLEVTAAAGGSVLAVLVDEKDTIKQGDVVARLSLPELDTRIKHKQEELANLQQQVATQRLTQMGIISEKNKELQSLKQRDREQKDLVDRGYLAESVLQVTRRGITNLQEEIASIRASFDEMQNRLDSLAREISELEGQRQGAEIRSPYAGHVLEVTAQIGDLLQPGYRILRLEDLEAPMDAKIYIPAAEGKKVEPGMQVQVSPSTVKSEEWGFMLGKVSRVSDFPVTPERLRKVLGNEKLVADLVGRSAPIEVVAALIKDDTPSGFKWTSSKGPNTRISTGTVCTANVTVDRKPPISYVLPIFRKIRDAVQGAVTRPQGAVS